MILFELLTGFVVIGLLVFVAILFTNGSRRRGAPRTGLISENSAPAHDGAEKPRNKANMDQPQEEFIAPQGARETVDESKK